jgi:ferredoxin--NADP+ reductase
VIPNADGRVLGADGEPIPGMYCAGWIKRGPSGVIGTNKRDASETAAHVLEDAEAGALPAGGGDLAELLDARGLPYVDYEGWQAIDRHEQSLGAPHGRPRTKLATWDELLHHGRRL